MKYINEPLSDNLTPFEWLVWHTANDGFIQGLYVLFFLLLVLYIASPDKKKRPKRRGAPYSPTGNNRPVGNYPPQQPPVQPPPQPMPPPVQPPQQPPQYPYWR